MDYKTMVSVIVNGSLLTFIAYQIYQMNAKLASITTNIINHKELIDKNNTEINAIQIDLESTKISALEAKLKSQQALFEIERFNRG
jgi:hypothetical protein